MTDLRIRITESDGIRYATGVNPYASTLYIGENIPDTLDAILDALQDYARAEPTAMVRALSFNAEFCQLAAAVHGLHLAESDATPAAEAIAILTKLRDSRQPEAIRTRAGNLLIDIAEDDRAVCDASSVDEQPGQDAGAALVGVECYVKDTNDKEWCVSDPPLKITAYREGLGYSRLPNPRKDQAFDWWNHASPAYLGKPTP